MELSHFITRLYLENPFFNVYLITADDKIFGQKLEKYNKTIVDNSFAKSLKGLTFFQQKAVLDSLEAEGHLWSLGPDYRLQLDYWLEDRNRRNGFSPYGWLYGNDINLNGSFEPDIHTKDASL